MRMLAGVLLLAVVALGLFRAVANAGWEYNRQVCVEVYGEDEYCGLGDTKIGRILYGSN